jgi:hypothetical protein
METRRLKGSSKSETYRKRPRPDDPLVTPAVGGRPVHAGGYPRHAGPRSYHIGAEVDFGSSRWDSRAAAGALVSSCGHVVAPPAYHAAPAPGSCAVTDFGTRRSGAFAVCHGRTPRVGATKSTSIARGVRAPRKCMGV